MKPNTKHAIFFGLLLCVAAAVWMAVSSTHNYTRATYSQFLQQVRSGAVTGAVILAANSGTNQITYVLKSGGQLRATVPADYRQALALMQDRMVNIEIRDASSQWFRVLANSSPFLVLVAVWIFMLPRVKRWRRTPWPPEAAG